MLYVGQLTDKEGTNRVLHSVDVQEACAISHASCKSMKEVRLHQLHNYGKSGMHLRLVVVGILRPITAIVSV